MQGVGKFARSIKGIALASVVIAVVLFAAVSAMAAKVTPEFIAGSSNKTCSELARAGQSWTELKVDPNGNGTFSDGTLTVTISNTTNDKTFDWSSNIGVDAVFVKAGSDGSNLYRYDDPTSNSDPGEQTSDTGLTSPDATGNQISHITFCYDVEQSPSPSPSVSPSESETPSPSVSPTESETPSTSPSPSVSPTESETPSTSPSPSVSPSETESPGPTVSVLPSQIETTPATVLGKKLSKTGTDIVQVALLALALMVLGAGAYVIATRAARNKA